MERAAFVSPGRHGRWRNLTAAVLTLTLVAVPPAKSWAAVDAAQEKALCKRNLRLIYDAIQAYRLAHRDLPNSLSELVPAFLSDPEILYCPEARRKALTSIAVTRRPGFSDARTSYFYEFSNVPVEEFPNRTNRDWKRAQMGLLGSVVPIVRCLVHDRPINLSFGGEIYECDKLEWEYKFTNLVPMARLRVEALLSPLDDVRVIQIPPRDPAATTNEVDLSAFYNAGLTQPWLAREPAQQLTGLPPGLQEFGGTRFDVRGVVQLSSRGLGRLGERFPERVRIPLHRSGHQLQFLIGATFSDKDGAQAGRFDIRFANGQVEQVPLRLGTELGLTWKAPADPPPPTGATVAWQGPAGNPARLFRVSWTNPQPAIPLDAVECVGGTNTVAFFLVGLSMTP